MKSKFYKIYNKNYFVEVTVKVIDLNFICEGNRYIANQLQPSMWQSVSYNHTKTHLLAFLKQK